MQQKSENFSEYSERTEALARNLGVNLSDLPEKIGVSNSMFHAYRSGKYPISQKAWRKLEQAEEAHARTHLTAARESIEKLMATQSSSHPKQGGVGDSAHLSYAESAEGDQRRSQTAATDPVLLGVLERIAASLAEIARKLP